MKEYLVTNIYGKIKNKEITVDVPGSKSITNRALLLATLANGKSVLKNVLFSDDSRHFLKCIEELGFETKVDEENRVIEVTGLGGAVPKKEASIYVGSAGTAARFLSAFLGVSNGVYHIDASAQMRKRPMAPLLECLKELGCEVDFDENEGFFPFTLTSNGFGKKKIAVDIGSSSQFLSALMIAMPLSCGIEIEVLGNHGLAYIHMTEKMMNQFGVSIDSKDRFFAIEGKKEYKAREYVIEPDASGAAYFFAMAPLLGISVTIPNLHWNSLQGDVEFLKILEKMGCMVSDTETGLQVSGKLNGEFDGVDYDMSACSDQAITVACLAPFAKSETVIRGIGHIRLQESDRMLAIVTELKKMGIECEMGEDWIRIKPGNPKPAHISTYEDHRMAMGFSLCGLRADNIVIDDPDCCRKTFENYFEVLDKVSEILTK